MRTLSHAHVAAEPHDKPSRSESAEGKPSKSIFIDEHGGVSIDKQTIDLRAVRAHVERFKAVDAEGGIVVVADRLAPTGAVVVVAENPARRRCGHDISDDGVDRDTVIDRRFSIWTQ